jgi:hypothetical protein
MLTSCFVLFSAPHSTLNFGTELLHPFWHRGRLQALAEEAKNSGVYFYSATCVF